MGTSTDFKAALVCADCHGPLHISSGTCVCAVCGKSFPRKEGKFLFVEGGRATDAAPPDAIIYTLKNYFKAHLTWVFVVLYNTVAIFVGKRPKVLVREEPEGALMLNVGSGIMRIDPRVVNIDIAPEPGVDVVASAYALPFRDESADLVVSESLLEHLEHPERAVAEMHRVLKPGGRAYILTPFMLGFHSSPNDFRRWTLPGMKILLKDFTVTESGIAVGPTGALVSIVREWLAMVLSFGSRTLYQLWILFFMILFIPLNIIDYVISRFSYASTIAMSYYWIAEKK